MSSNGYFDDIEEPELEAFDAVLDPSVDDAEVYDAFNEDTFGNPLEGDWESEHDKLLLLENENVFDGTLTKFDDFDDKFNGSEDELERESNKKKINGCDSRISSNEGTSKNNKEFKSLENATYQSCHQSNDFKQDYMNEMQLIQQLQLQQQQQQLLLQQQFQKNQIMQQHTKQQFSQQQSSGSASISPHFMLNQDQKGQFLSQQQQQFNSAMLAALVSRNQLPMQQSPIINLNQFQGNNNFDRKTPVNINQFNETASNTNNSINFNQPKNSQSELNSLNFFGNIKNMQSNNNCNNNENETKKIKNFMEKMNQLNNNQIVQSKPSSQNLDSFGPREAVLNSKLNENNNLLSMFGMFQHQQNQNNPLPKLPNSKIKTLEEIESELLASNQPKSNSVQPNQANNKIDNSKLNIQTQNANHNLNKFFPMLLTNSGSSNQMSKLNDNNDMQAYIQKQKQLLEQLSMSKKQQQFQNQLSGGLNNMNDLQQQQLMLMQQQIMQSQMNLSAFLPPNFQNLNQQQKQLTLNQIQRNLQISLMQQQQIINQNRNQNQNNLNIDNQLLSNDLNNNRYNDNMKNRSHNNNGGNSGINNRNQLFNNQNRQGKNNKQNQRNNSTSGDKLAGMMTDKEKNWVTNVQMLQLQIDDPYRYDYYYTAWMLKKKQFSQRNTSSAGLKTSVIHSLDNKYNKDQKTYRPLTFENSLGKVTMSNFHHPRALIDVKSGDEQIESELAGEISELDLDDKVIDKEKNIDTILLEIEKMYQVLLNIDEIEHSILKANDEMRAILFQDRRAKVDKLAAMLCTENFAHYLFVDKGKRLLSKCIPTFNLAQTKLVLGFLMQYIYIIAKNNISLDELYSHISYAIDTQKFADLADIVNQFVHLYSRQSAQLYHTIFSNKFCLSFLLKFFSKSDLINQDDFESDQKTIWSCFLNLVLVGLTVVQPVSSKPDGSPSYNVSEICQLNFNIALECFDINRDVWSKNESKLKELFTSV